jgi:hypothetical protein
MAIGLARLVLVDWPWAWFALRDLKFDLQRRFRVRRGSPVTQGKESTADWSASPI